MRKVIKSKSLRGALALLSELGYSRVAYATKINGIWSVAPCVN